MDLAFLDDGMVRDAIALDRGLGFSDANVIVGATHTHGSQSGYMNFTSYNSILPSTATQQGRTTRATCPSPVWSTPPPTR